MNERYHLHQRQGSLLSAALIALIGTALGSFSGFKLTSYRVEQLEIKVDKHNNFAQRMPVVEEKIREINHRLEDIETK